LRRAVGRRLEDGQPAVEQEERDGQEDALARHAGEGLTGDAPRISAGQVPDQQDGDEGRAGEVIAGRAEEAEEPFEKLLGRECGALAFGEAAVEERHADLVGEDHGEEEDEALQRAMGDVPIVVGGAGPLPGGLAR
jgi:hypothetical protein